MAIGGRRRNVIYKKICDGSLPEVFVRVRMTEERASWLVAGYRMYVAGAPADSQQATGATGPAHF